MHRFGRLLLALGIGVLGMTGITLSAAQEASPVAGPGLAPAGCVVVADGLINPRFVALASDGTLYITEAGSGGSELLVPADSDDARQAEGTPEEGAATEGDAASPLTRGSSGRVTAVSPEGVQTVIMDGLPSYTEGVGPTGIVLGDGVIWITVGGAAVLAGAEPMENENSVLRYDIASGEVTLVAELGSFEKENNPDGTDVNPNLYGMGLGAEGWLYVNDAGGNTIYRVNPATGEFALLGVVPGPTFPETGSPDAEASPIADEELLGSPQAVPTGLHVGADGNVYVVTLGAFIPGASEVLIAQANGTFVQVAAGFSVGIGVSLGPDGLLYVSQLASFESDVPGPGSVVRINADGTTETVVDGISFPHGITFDAAGNLYVVANSTAFGPPPSAPNGQLLRCDGIAAV